MAVCYFGLYNYFRYYDPSTGRYITSDAIGLSGGLNTYIYVGGNPLIGVDLFGLVPLEGTGTSSPGKPGNPISGPYRPPPSTADKIASAILKQALKQIAKQYGIPPQLVGTSIGIFGSIILFVTPSPLGCSSFDCNNNGIPDTEEQVPEQCR